MSVVPARNLMIPRRNNAAIMARVLAVGEMVYNKTTKSLHVGDGFSLGGTRQIGDKGDPGGNILAIGRFTDAATISIPVGTDLVRTSGYNTKGIGVADYVYDAAVDAAYVASKPTWSFMSMNGRGFRMVDRQVVTPLMFGGKADNGITDNGPAFRAAMAFLGLQGGGTWFLPAGRYKAASGDPRGLNWSVNTGVNQFYTICEAVSGVTVEGEGDASVIITDPARLGPNTVAPVGRQDGGALFANFRVSNTSNNAPTAVSYFAMKNIRHEWTAVPDQTKDLVEGHTLRIESNAGAVVNGTIMLNNVSVLNSPGHQIFNAGRIDLFSAHNVRITNPGRAVNAANTDHSCFFITGTKATIEACSGMSSQPFGTFAELHCRSNLVSLNTTVGFGTFCNAVSQTVHTGAAYDYSVFEVHDNTAEGVGKFVVDYCYTVNRKKLLSIKDNTVMLTGPLSTSDEAMYITANDSGAAVAAILPTEKVIMEGNTVSSQDPSVAISGITQSNSIIVPEYVQELVIRRNHFYNIRRGLLSTFSTKLTKLKVGYNDFDGISLRGLSDSDGTYATSRTMFNIVLVPGSSWQQIDFVKNNMQNSYVGAADAIGIHLNNQVGGATNIAINIYKNDIDIVDGGPEIKTSTRGAGTWAVQSVKVNHTYRAYVGADAYPRVTLGLATPNSIANGSEARLGSAVTRAVYDGVNNQFPTEFYGSALPATGFYHYGSIMRYYAPAAGGYRGQICTASGVVGGTAVWKGFGLIQA